MSFCVTIAAAWCNIHVQVSWQCMFENADGHVGMRARVYARMLLIVEVKLFLSALAETRIMCLAYCAWVLLHTHSAAASTTQHSEQTALTECHQPAKTKNGAQSCLGVIDMACVLERSTEIQWFNEPASVVKQCSRSRHTENDMTQQRPDGAVR